MTIRVDIIDTKGTKRVEAVPFETVVKKDSSLTEGTSKVTREGKAGSRTVTYRQTLQNGKVVSTKRTGSKVTSQPVSKVVVQGTKPKPAPKPAASQPASAPSRSSASAPRAAATAPSSGSTSGAGINLSNAAMWDRIAQCESTGRWNINTGNGYYGGLQFDYGTWLSVGGDDFAPRADLASRAEQITVANRLYAQRGLQPWGCAHAA